MSLSPRPSAASAPDLEAMSFFASAMELSSFAAAARRLGLSRSVVSRRIAAIEARLGIALLRRTTRSLVLTEAGQDYLEHSRRVVALAAEGERSARGLTDAPSGVLRIAATGSLGRLLLAPLLSGFSARYPQLRLDVRLSDRRVELIEEGFDLALRLTDHPPEDLRARQIEQLSYQLCAAPSYLAQLPDQVTPESLQHADWLMFGSNQKKCRVNFTAPDGTRSQLVVAPRLQCNDLDTLFRAAVSGMGIIILPVRLLGEAFERSDLQVLLPNHSVTAGYPTKIWALTAPGARVAAKVRVFWDYLQEATRR